MKATLVHSPLGIFAFDADDRLVGKAFSPREPDAAADVLRALSKGDVVEGVRRLKTQLEENGYDELVFEDHVLASAFGRENVKATVDVEASNGVALRRRVEELALETGLFASAGELQDFLHDVSVSLARSIVKEESGRRDLTAIQVVQTVDDLDHTFNLFANRLREWHGYHFPEMGGLVNESDIYARLVASLDGRDRFTVASLAGLGLSSEKAEELERAAQGSMGADLFQEDLDEVVGFARLLLELHESKTRLEKYLETVMQQVAPNTATLLGSTLGARLIAVAGGVENLAKRSASTIQVLGAEKALFRSLRSGSRPPKHGLIFQHKDVHQAPKWQRGKIARALASKAAIAIRLDAYHGEYRGQLLLKDYEERVKEIREKYPEPPPRGGKSGRG